MSVYKTYSRRCCIMECRARKMQDKCGCLPYYYPMFSQVWRKRSRCTFEGLMCLANMTSKLFSLY